MLKKLWGLLTGRKGKRGVRLDDEWPAASEIPPAPPFKPARMGSNPRPSYPAPPAPPPPPPVRQRARPEACRCSCCCRGPMPDELERLCAQLPAHAVMLVRRSWEGR